MNSDLKSIFEHVVTLDGTLERNAYLDGVLAGETGKRREIEGLLNDARRAEAFFEDFETRGPAAPRRPAGDEGPGAVIGRYKLQREIGAGAFGTVWMAEQTEPVRRRVALKIMRMGMDTREFVARFEQERQALAMMEHPHIARVFDAGATPSGRPYLVMELVRGIPITKFCDSEQLPMKDRLALFMQVCQAIGHAHQKGIIHRDIKPANILVAPGDDGAPVVKVIDFGVAKALDRTLTDQTLCTQLEQLVGTPAYMSPEQAGLSPMDVDTRSDIYALGVLLYEMLTGEPPFNGHDLLRAGVDEMRRLIREETPPKPSTRLSTMAGPALTGLARSRHLEAPRLLASVKGDLDWIVMKALEKSRARRYDSASGFAADIERFLRREPVLARPPTFSYRAGKWVRKHKGAAVAVCAVLLALLTGLGAFAWQAHRTARERDKAQNLVSVLMSIVESRAANVSDFLGGAAQKIDEGLAEEPEQRLSILAALGETCHAMGFHEQAVKLQRKVYDGLSAGHDPADRRVLKARGALAWSLYDSGSEHKATAIQMQVEIAALCESALPKNDSQTIYARLRLAVSYYHFHEKERGRGMLEALLPVSRNSRPDAPETLEIMHWLAVMRQGSGDRKGAGDLLRNLVPLCRRVFGEDHLEALRAQGAFAKFLLEEKDKNSRKEALRQYRNLKERCEICLGPKHFYTLSILLKLASACKANGEKGEEVGLLLQRAYDSMVEIHTIEHSDTLWALTELLNFREARLKDLPNPNREEWAKLLTMRRQAVEISARLPDLGPEHASTLGRIVRLADALAATDEPAAAVQKLEGVKQILDSAGEMPEPDYNWVVKKLNEYRQRVASPGVLRPPAGPQEDPKQVK